MKRRFSIILILLFLLAVACCARGVADFGIEDGYYYSVTEGEATITGFDQKTLSVDGKLTIPSKLGGYPVTSIGSGAFTECTSLVSVTIPNGVTSIGSCVFIKCASLESVTIPNSVASIGDSAFQNCTNLKSVTIPNGVMSIDEFVFYGCTSLESLTIPNSITSIEMCAFNGCTSLESVTIPNSVTSIGVNAFEKCTNLKNVTIGSGVTRIEEFDFLDCSGLTSVTLLNGVSSIGKFAFYNCTSLTSIIIPSSVTSIGNDAFYNTNNTKDIWYGGTQASWDALGQYKPSGTLHIISPYGIGTQEDPYKIQSADHWNSFSKYNADGVFDTTGKYFSLAESISVSTMMGTADYPFSGIFDGNGKTLTVSINETDNCAAPFSYIIGATIKNLKVTGSVTGGKHCAGLVGAADGSGENLVENCEVAVTVKTSGTHCGGILGHGTASVTTIRGCVFSGNIGDKTAGTIWGWSDTGATAQIVNCLDTSNCKHPIGRSNGNLKTNSSVKNTYFTYDDKLEDARTPWKDSSKQAYKVTADDVVTIKFSTGTKYAVSGITVCDPGLLYNGVFLAGEKEQISMTLTGGSDVEGIKKGYYATKGKLTASGSKYTLTMPSKDVVIVVKNIIKGIQYTEGSKDCALVLADRSTWASGWYFVKDNTIAQSRVNVIEDVNLILADGITLTVAKGIHVPEGSSLTIWTQAGGTGALSVTGPDDNLAGIGGDNGESCGTITIHGGVIYSHGGNYGAGIGGGNEGAGGDVKIYGGDVHAAGRNGSAGIGGGDYANGGKVTIAGGKVMAMGSIRSNTSQASAGIGSGRPRADGSKPLKAGSCTITGGTVIAISGNTNENIGAQAIGANFQDVKANASNAGTLSIPATHLVISQDDENALPVLPAQREASCRGGYVRIQVCGHSYEKNTSGKYVCKWCGAETDRLPTFGKADFFLPDSLKRIDNYAFEGVKLGTIDIPDTCLSIGKGAFRNSTLMQIRIPADCVIASDALEGCAGAVVFGVAGSAEVSAARGSCMFVEK